MFEGKDGTKIRKIFEAGGIGRGGNDFPWLSLAGPEFI